jgi:hypothetical protein
MSVIYNEKHTDRYVQRYADKNKFLTQRTKGSRTALLLFSSSSYARLGSKFFPSWLFVPSSANRVGCFSGGMVVVPSSINQQLLAYCQLSSSLSFYVNLDDPADRARTNLYLSALAFDKHAL